MKQKSMLYTWLAGALLVSPLSLAGETEGHDAMAAGDHGMMQDEKAMQHDMQGDMQGMQHEMQGMDHDANHEMHTGHGVVRHLDAENHMINIAHDPIPSLGWPSMRMNFEMVDGLDLSGIADGDTVSFTLQVDENGDYKVCEIKPAE